jgi:succinate dehydrogenase flavin-adding protein (antitoxin of CptAB toxin-antitoxin module)
MLENDLVLERFMERHGESLEGARLAGFRRLLECPDGVLWDLICRRARTDDPEVEEILRLMQDQ